MSILLRRAVPADASAIARVHIAAWRTTYSSLLPAAEVALRTDWALRLAAWEARLQAERLTFVADDDGTLLGFCSTLAMPPAILHYGPLLYDNYLEGFYLLAEAQQRGLGRMLLAAVATDLIASGSRSLALHVLATNPARAFYERMGAEFVRDEPAAGDETWHQCAYVFKDLSALTAR